MEAQIRLTVTINEEDDGTFSAFCPELGLATCGKTFEEADRRINKAIDMVINAAEESDETRELLADRGIPIYYQVPDARARSRHQWETSTRREVPVCA